MKNYHFFIILFLLLLYFLHPYLCTIINNKITFDQILNINIKKKKYHNNNVVFLFIIDFEKVPDYYKYSYEIINKYCKIHNYEFLIKNHFNDINKINHYWWRVYDLINLCSEYEPNTIFIHIDIDACINPKYFNLSIDDLLNRIYNITYKEYDMFVSMDMKSGGFYAKIMCAGVFIIRNTCWSRKILKYWWSKYNTNNWTLINGNWICKENNKICEYARDNYDQGELNNLYNNNILNSQNHILQLDYSVLSDRGDFENECFIYHLMALSDDDRTTRLKLIYDIM